MAIRLSPGARVAAYAIRRYLATGGEGDTHEASTTRGVPTALKQLNFSASDPHQTENLQRAFRLKRLVGKRSPYVGEIFDVFVHDDLVYIAMEWVSGHSLEQLFEAKKRLGLELVIPVMGECLAGLAWLHGLELVHRDVKPANIIVSESVGSFSAKLIDLGIALDRTLPRLTCKGGIAATPEYAAPETLSGGEGKVDHRADFFALGATIFHLLTGRLPFPEPGRPLRRTFMSKLCAAERPSMRAYVPTIPESIDEYVQRLMSVRPEDRPSSAAIAWEELQRAVSGSGIPDETAAPAKSPSSLTRGVGALVGSRTAGAWNLYVASGPLEGATITVPKGGITLGRTSLNPTDGSISRFHVRVKPRKSGIVLRDLGSLNGLIHRDRRVRRAVLAPGEEVLVGQTLIQLVS
jgi:serine/threonine-protein kinase